MRSWTAENLADPRRIRPDERELYSSAATLSDMEIFVFPRLLFSLVLANILSPRLWAWRDDPWFNDIHKLKPYRRVLRLKQFIIDHYEFNLDLDTWGLTRQETELQRFSPWIDEDTVSKSNALFGYEGDKYYFALDIRRHFGLDKYEGNIIPYWKTETLEAMDAFIHRPGYRLGAGECVSLSTLYAAAMFVVCGIPLDDIFLLATPLHSQNYVLLNDGVITNNRRIVTKNMWFNGTEQTDKAQRALRNEQVTIVAHHTGYIHCVYPHATIDPGAYERFKDHLGNFLKTDVNIEILANFLRLNSPIQHCFQFCHDCHGRARWIEAEKIYAYEHTSSFKASDRTREKLLAEIDEDLFYTEKIPGRICVNSLDQIFHHRKYDLSRPDDIAALKQAISCECTEVAHVVDQLAEFSQFTPRFPDHDSPRDFVPTPSLPLTPDMTRDEILSALHRHRDDLLEADLAFYTYRDLRHTDWTPFVQGALERNPVCQSATRDLDDETLIQTLSALPPESIYDGSRCAHPDEVWNFQRGDGFEIALTLATIWCQRHPDHAITLRAEAEHVSLDLGPRHLSFATTKDLLGHIDIRMK